MVAPPYSTSPSRLLVMWYLATVVLCIRQLSHSDMPRLSVAQLGTSNSLTTAGLLALRLASAAVVWVTLAWRVTNSRGSFMELARFRASRLRPMEMVLGGPRVLTTFTTQCWLIQGLFFTGSAACSAAALVGAAPALDASPAGPVLACVVCVTFEVGFATALLTSAVVTHVLIPSTLKRGVPPIIFFTTHQQLLHCLNLYFMLTELLVGRVPLLLTDFPYIVIFGLLYVAFGWAWCRYTGGVVYYPFLDPTLPPQHSIPIHLVLLIVLAAFHAAGCALQAADSVEWLPLPCRVLGAYAGGWLLVWTRRKGVPLPPDGKTFMPWVEAAKEYEAGRRPVSDGWRPAKAAINTTR